MYFTLRTTYYLYYNSKRKVRKVSIDDGVLQLDDKTDLREQEAYNYILYNYIYK